MIIFIKRKHITLNIKSNLIDYLTHEHLVNNNYDRSFLSFNQQFIFIWTLWSIMFNLIFSYYPTIRNDLHQ